MQSCGITFGDLMIGVGMKLSVSVGLAALIAILPSFVMNRAFHKWNIPVDVYASPYVQFE